MNSLLVLLSFLVALVLSSLPLPDIAIVFRPEWLMLVLIYWCMAIPDRIGIFTGWLLGLVLDVMYGSLLGQNAVALAIVAYLVNTFHLRVRVFPIWQQSFTVFLLTIVYLTLIAWVRGVAGGFPITWAYWIPSLTSAFVWPFIYILLRDLRRQRVSSREL
ncbi:Rod shape-determining protein MreD [bacterium BMS3Bbin11]|nr:Rod shape-determining protein MreD [bacterium BMS3Abin11]GBE46182.1 Rod shape-determining protein MreD [bacterium BMS3Bbin11]GMT41291.1 MAG: rod shape-determining protein MreD [bacterium]HDH08459.1 rod shape-determining protein MreD [Gammaproteobacteria bacterium]HDH15009.1 rod shape-determining protein MreD [Gammaproteobacteria bacterium]